MSIQSLKNEVKTIKEQLNPNHKIIRVLFHFHRNGEPHGFLGSQWLVMEDGEEINFEAATRQEELESFSREEYEKTDPEHVLNYEKWIEIHRCKCGHHGEDGRQPFLGTTTLVTPSKELRKHA